MHFFYPSFAMFGHSSVRLSLQSKNPRVSVSSPEGGGKPLEAWNRKKEAFVWQ